MAIVHVIDPMKRPKKGYAPGNIFLPGLTTRINRTVFKKTAEEKDLLKKAKLDHKNGTSTIKN